MRCNAQSPGTEPISPAFDLASLTVVTPTSLEYRIARAELPNINVVRAGIALSALDPTTLSDTVISCGLAGGLADLPTGTVVLPETLHSADGATIACDALLVKALRESASALGLRYSGEPLLSAGSIVRGDERRLWAARGFVAADMESALLRGSRIAAVRVILDTPQHELHRAWLHPATVLFHPRAWFELPWLAKEAPRCARIAARVIRNALKAPLI